MHSQTFSPRAAQFDYSMYSRQCAAVCCSAPRSGAKHPVPRVDIIVQGFACQSMSSENNNRGQFKGAVKQGHGTTGITFRGGMHSPWMQCLVPGSCSYGLALLHRAVFTVAGCAVLYHC